MGWHFVCRRLRFVLGSKIVAATLLLPIASCTFPVPYTSTNTTVHVEVDLYSGRPNPGWDLLDADARRFIELLDALPAASPDAGGGLTSAEGLGYRGLKVEIESGDQLRRIRIAGGVVHVEEAEASRRRSDPGRVLEQWLLRTGEQYLGAELLRYLLQQATEQGPGGG